MHFFQTIQVPLTKYIICRKQNLQYRLLSKKTQTIALIVCVFLDIFINSFHKMHLVAGLFRTCCKLNTQCLRITILSRATWYYKYFFHRFLFLQILIYHWLHYTVLPIKKIARFLTYRPRIACSAGAKYIRIYVYLFISHIVFYLLTPCQF